MYIFYICTYYPIRKYIHTIHDSNLTISFIDVIYTACILILFAVKMYSYTDKYGRHIRNYIEYVVRSCDSMEFPYE